MRLLRKGTRQSAAPGCQVEFDEKGRVSNITVPQSGGWAAKQNGGATYYTRRTGSLLEATEILKRVKSIPKLTYYVVDTPDGSLGRDMNGYYTEAPLKTKNLKVASQSARPGTVEFSSLTDTFGEPMVQMSTVASQQKTGQYARLVLLMECGHCGYQSPVETQAGPFVRECYCCGAENKGERGTLTVFLGGSMVRI